MKNPDIKFLLIDLFCGAGGTTTGAEASGVCKVIAAINHDPLAIASHTANHQDALHLTEDILVADIRPVQKAVAHWKGRYPRAKLILWASLECTNFSNAKGGLPRDADSRSLAHGMFRYLDVLNPDYFLIENVREFMAWGDLDENGKPVSKTNGREYVRWVKQVQSCGYQHDWRLLNAANFGGVTIRERYFGAFWKPGSPFAWPQPTHAKRPAKGDLFADEMKPWRAVAEVLDFSDLGSSIFERKRDLVDKTLRRILEGLKKFHTKPQIMLCNTPGYCVGIDRPIPTLTTVNSKAMITPMLQSYYGGSFGVRSVNQPAATITTKDRLALVTPWIDRNFKTGGSQSIEQPAWTLLTVPKMNLCSAFIVNPSFGSNGSAISKPAPTVIAKQKSYPLSLATATSQGLPHWEPTDTDTETMVQLKEFMRENGIADIFMRMLKIVELKRIQGFPDGYVLHGPLNEQKKFIGNSVETGVVKAWVRAMAGEVSDGAVRQRVVGYSRKSSRMNFNHPAQATTQTT